MNRPEKAFRLESFFYFDYSFTQKTNNKPQYW
jgi:hypothetical protein